MIRGVVSDKVDLNATVVAKDLIQKLKKCRGVENLYEPRVPLGIRLASAFPLARPYQAVFG